MNKQDYLKMQKNYYNDIPVTSSESAGYRRHDNWKDYDEFLFKGIDTKNLVALDYGTGKGRNIVKFNNEFKRIDGVDIGEVNIENAKTWVGEQGITNSKLFVCDGSSIPVDDESYDVVFSVVVFQHICCYDVRFSIFKDIYRALKPGGHFCFQMAYGGSNKAGNTKTERNIAGYYENVGDAGKTNGHYDVSVMDPNDLKSDLVDKIGFKTFVFDIRPVGPCDWHKNWIFVRAQK